MSYQFIILGISVAAALYYYLNGKSRHRPHAYNDGTSWDYEAKYKGKRAECTICLEIMTPNSQITLNPCKHTFHKSCLGAFMLRHAEGTCPNCRQSFS